MFSPLCFIIALAYAFKKVDPGGGSNILGWLIDTLTYADDAALIDSTAEQATVRITAIAISLKKLADMEISCGKTKCLFVEEQVYVETDTLFGESNAEALEKVLQHKRDACGRGFSTHQGLKTHEAIWCGSMGREIGHRERLRGRGDTYTRGERLPRVQILFGKVEGI